MLDFIEDFAPFEVGAGLREHGHQLVERRVGLRLEGPRGHYAHVRPLAKSIRSRRERHLVIINQWLHVASAFCSWHLVRLEYGLEARRRLRFEYKISRGRCNLDRANLG